MKIGIAGTGRMGAAMALRLIGVGHEVHVWNRSREKTQPLADAGARVESSPATLASAADLIITILTDAKALAATYGGSEGLLATDVKEKLFVEMSTVSPA